MMKNQMLNRTIEIEALESRALLSAGAPDVAARANAAERLHVEFAHTYSLQLMHPGRDVATAEQHSVVVAGTAALAEPLHGELPPGWQPPLNLAAAEPPGRDGQFDLGGHHRHSGTHAQPTILSFFGIAFSSAVGIAPIAGLFGPTFDRNHAPPPPEGDRPTPAEMAAHFQEAFERIAQSAAGTDQSFNTTPAARPADGASAAVTASRASDAPDIVDSARTHGSAAKTVSAAAPAASNRALVHAAGEPTTTAAERITAKLAAVFASTAIAAPTTSAEVMSATVTKVARTVGTVAVPAAQAVAIAAPVLFYFPRMGSASSFMFDSIAALTEEFALPDLGAEQAAPSRALMVTAVVIAADVALLTILFRRRPARHDRPSAIAIECRYNHQKI